LTNNLWFNRTYGNMLVFGAYKLNYPPFNPILTPQEAYSLDKKIDDGSPVNGNIIAALSSVSPQSQCTTAAGNSTVLTATYDTSKDDVACALFFLLPQNIRGPKSLAESPYY